MQVLLSAGERGRRRGERLLLREHERVRHGVEPVVGKEPQHERPPDALIRHRQVLHAVAEGHERLPAALVVHLVREPVVCRGRVRQRREARKKRVWALVSEQEGEQLLLAVDHALGQHRGGVLAENMVADDSGHPSPSIGFTHCIVPTARPLTPGTDSELPFVRFWFISGL